jgi:hypothetical protein
MYDKYRACVSMNKELYLAQIGYYPNYAEDKLYPKFEVHTTIFICAESPEDAIKLVRKTHFFTDKNLHAQDTI